MLWSVVVVVSLSDHGILVMDYGPLPLPFACHI